MAVLLYLDFVDYGDYDWRMACSVKENMGDILFNLFLHRLNVVVGRDAAIGLGAEIVANFTN